MTSETALAIVKGDVKVRRTDKPIHIYQIAYSSEYASGWAAIARPYKVTLPVWPDHTVFAHRSMADMANRHEWTVTEPYTGAVIGWGRTRREAAERAEENIERHGTAMMHDYMADAIREHGLSPAFEVVQ